MSFPISRESPSTIDPNSRRAMKFHCSTSVPEVYRSPLNSLIACATRHLEVSSRRQRLDRTARRRHVAHHRVFPWFEDEGMKCWATCPITQNGVIRILGHPSYPGGHADCGLIAALLSELCHATTHVFWPDDLDLLTSDIVRFDRLPSSKHLTDTYLFALACSRDAKLVTLDRKISTAAVTGGGGALHLID